MRGKGKVARKGKRKDDLFERGGSARGGSGVVLNEWSEVKRGGREGDYLLELTR